MLSVAEIESHESSHSVAKVLMTGRPKAYKVGEAGAGQNRQEAVDALLQLASVLFPLAMES